MRVPFIYLLYTMSLYYRQGNLTLLTMAIAVTNGPVLTVRWVSYMCRHVSEEFYSHNSPMAPVLYMRKQELKVTLQGSSRVESSPG